MYPAIMEYVSIGLIIVGFFGAIETVQLPEDQEEELKRIDDKINVRK